MAELTTERDLVLDPVPQDLVQEPYLDQPETLQSMAHWKVLQVVEEVRVGQLTPPWARELTTERDLVLEPVPQDLVQAPYLDQAEILQSTGQPKVLQDLVFLRATQATPPNWAAVMVERARDLVPEAQVAEQALKRDQEETLQSMAHLTVLQERQWRSMLQPMPPKRTLVMMDLERDCLPVAQVLVQVEKADQLESLQSMGQACTLQTRCSPGGQGLPLYLSGVMMM